jgi:hypothetical protein
VAEESEVVRLASRRIGRPGNRTDGVPGVGEMAVVYAASHRNKKRFPVKMLYRELDDIRSRCCANPNAF